QPDRNTFAFDSAASGGPRRSLRNGPPSCRARREIGSEGYDVARHAGRLGQLRGQERNRGLPSCTQKVNLNGSDIRNSAPTTWTRSIVSSRTCTFGAICSTVRFCRGNGAPSGFAKAARYSSGEVSESGSSTIRLQRNSLVSVGSLR